MCITSHYHHAVCRLVVGLFILGGLAGCGKGMRSVEGDVTFKDGQPLKGGMVIFEPMNPQAQNISPRGDIGEDGKFQMSTFAAGDGVPEGQYRVYLTPPLPANPNDIGRVKFVPAKYESPETSGLTFEVTSTKKPLRIALERP